MIDFKLYGSYRIFGSNSWLCQTLEASLKPKTHIWVKHYLQQVECPAFHAVQVWVWRTSWVVEPGGCVDVARGGECEGVFDHPQPFATPSCRKKTPKIIIFKV